MKFLLTSGGVNDPAIREALVGLLGKRIEESNALAIPTASYGHPWSTPPGPYRFITGTSEQPMTGLGWKSVGVLELTALPHIDPERWQGWVRDADVLLASGGDAPFLAHFAKLSGLADFLPSLTDTV